jgi:ubiquinone/menaquinone biosynthesis C-methylase UbiE
MTQKEILAWDIATWGRALQCWEQHCNLLFPQGKKTLLGLEIGANHGGLTLFFTKKYGAKMVCSDVEPRFEQAKNLHNAHDVSQLVEYAQADALALPWPDGHFDFVVFKSVLGAVGRNGQLEKQQQSIAEMQRVLRPGGLLFFAENLRGAIFHRFLRKKFAPWGNAWRYVTLDEMEEFLGIFAQKEIRATGFLSAFVPRPEWLKTAVAALDRVLFFLPKNWRYVAYGYAQKSTFGTNTAIK